MNSKPNIILFVPDTFRADALGHLGNKASRTPVVDNLIKQEEAVSFENAFCQSPFCTPSRCSFMSGLYPHVNGHRTLTYMMEPHEPVLLRTLKNNGYYVWWGGRDDLIPAENDHVPYCDVFFRGDGKFNSVYDNPQWRGEPGNDDYYSFYAGKVDVPVGGVFNDCDNQLINGAIDFINNYQCDKPLCMYIALANPHAPYGVEEPWFSLIDREQVTLPASIPGNWDEMPSMMKGIFEKQNLINYSTDKWKELRAVYLGMCARVDAQLGMIIEVLKKKSLYENTALFFFSDHGDFTGDFGLVEKTQNTFQDCLTNVPLIIKPPSNISIDPGIKKALVELVDIVPTVCDLAGIELGYDQFGKSLYECLKGKKEHRDAVFCEGGRLHGETQCMESYDANLLNPESLYYPKVHTQHSEGPEHTKAVMCRTGDYKYVYRLYEKDEFYDLSSNKGETENLVDHPEYQHKISWHKDRLLRFMIETCDTVPRLENRR